MFVPDYANALVKVQLLFSVW